mgnify:CR=1 FL=1
MMSADQVQPSAISDQPNPAQKPQTPAHDRRRRRAQTLRSHLVRLMESFDEFRSILESAIEEVDREAKRNPTTDRDLVLNALHCGAWTVDELLEETKVTRPELDRILKDLIAAEIIFSKPSRRPNPKGGRPAILYFPVPNTVPEK